MKVYLSGPMTGLPDDNIPAFNRTAQALRACGYEVANPPELTAHLTAPPVNSPEFQHFYQTCLRIDIRALTHCDAIALMPGWERSNGAHLETHTAHRLGLTVWHVDDLLRAGNHHTRQQQAEHTAQQGSQP
jgi:hypothetical protein